MLLVTALLLAPASVSSVQENDGAALLGWTRFRGPNGSGVLDIEGLPDRLVPSGDASNLAWRSPVSGGFSSPVLWKGRIYLTALDGEDLVTLCVRARDGETLWRRTAPRPRRDKLDPRNHPASPTPCVGPEGVFVFFPEFGMLAYDHHAEELWRVELGPFDNVYGMGASPILYDGAVFLPCDQNRGSYFIALEAATGEVRWKVDRPEATSGHCTPILRPLDSDLGSLEAEILLPGSFTLDAYDPRTGERRWFAGGLSFEMKSVPVLWDDLVFTNGYGSPMNQPGNQVEVADFAEVVAERDADGDGRIGQGEMPQSRASAWFGFVDLDHDGSLDAGEWRYLKRALASMNGMLAFRPEGLGEQSPDALVWSYRRSVPQLPSPVVYRDALYMLNDAGGVLTTFRPRTGEVMEKGRLEAAVDTFYASPVAGDGKVYFASENGLVVVLPEGGGFEPLSASDLGEKVYATPALARVDGQATVIVRTTEALYAFQ